MVCSHDGFSGGCLPLRGEDALKIFRFNKQQQKKKMKLALNKIVGRPILHPTGVVTGYEFVEAMRKLAADPLPIKERYALARSLEDVERWVKIFEERKNELVLKHCESRIEFLGRKLAEVHEACGRGCSEDAGADGAAQPDRAGN
jgi:hypothetical protein